VLSLCVAGLEAFTMYVLAKVSSIGDCTLVCGTMAGFNDYDFS
jgi:hypothetical protein